MKSWLAYAKKQDPQVHEFQQEKRKLRMNAVDDEPTISVKDARKYARKVLKHYGVRRTRFVDHNLVVELENGDYGPMYRERQSTTWEPVTIGKSHRAKWKWFVENWLWSLNVGDSIGVDVHLSDRVPGQEESEEEPDMIYKPIIRPLRSRDLNSLAIELDILGRDVHAKQ